MVQHSRCFLIVLTVVLFVAVIPKMAQAQLEYPGTVEILGSE